MRKRFLIPFIILSIIEVFLIFPVRRTIADIMFIGGERLFVLNKKQYDRPQFYTRLEFTNEQKRDFLEIMGTENKYNHTFEDAWVLREHLLSVLETKFKKEAAREVRHPIKYVTHILELLKNNQNLSCAGFSYLYIVLLDAVGFKTRSIYLSKSIFRKQPNTHAVVEIFDEKRKEWISTGPYYNISFIAKGNLLSIMELCDLVYSKNTNEIEVLQGKSQHNSVKLPEYFSWLNVVIIYGSIPDTRCGWRHLSSYPPFRHFNNLYVTYVLPNHRYPLSKFIVFMHNIYSSITFFVLPLVIIAMAGIVIINLTNFVRGQRRQQHYRDKTD